MITLDKISVLLLEALDHEWGRIYNYCHQYGGQFTIAIGNIKKQFYDHPHMQILMTLKYWVKANNCTAQQFYDKIKPLMPDGYQSRLRELSFNGHHHGMIIVVITCLFDKLYHYCTLQGCRKVCLTKITSVKPLQNGKYFLKLADSNYVITLGIMCIYLYNQLCEWPISLPLQCYSSLTGL